MRTGEAHVDGGVDSSMRRQFEALVAHSPDAILRFDAQMRYICGNRMAERYLGVSAESLLGLRADELFELQANELGRPVMQPDEWIRGLTRVFESGKATSFEYTSHTPRGARVFEVRMIPECDDDDAFDTVLAVARDVTKERRHRRRLEESENRWRRLIEYAPDAVVVFADDRLVYCNRAAVRLYGVPTADDLVGRSVFDFFSAEDYTDVNKRLDKLYKGIELEPAHYRLIRSDGEEIEVETYSIPIRYAGKNAVQSVMRDVSEQREYEHKLIEARLRAEEVARLKSSIVANLSHEIRTPLANVLGFNEVLREHVDEAGLPMLESMRHGVERLMATLTAVLELGRLESEVSELSIAEVDLITVLRRAVSEAQPHAAVKQLSLELKTPEEGLLAMVDPDVVYEILWRLIDNALKFTHEGSVSVALDSNDGGDALILVCDTGIGIGTDFLPRVFDEFEQESKGLDRNYEGTGLGLAIVKRLADLCGAHISIESARGNGTTFSVCFPSVVARAA